jgi:O-antigen ligase
MRRLAYVLAILFVLTVPWEAAIQFGRIGTIGKVVGVVAGTIWLLSAIARGYIRPFENFHKLYFLFLIWSGLTFFWSVAPGNTLHELLTYTQLLLMVLMLWDLLDTRQRIETAIQAYVLGAFVTSGSIIANYLTSPAPKFADHYRVNALGYKTDGIALIVATAGPAAWYLATGTTWSHRSLALRVLNFAYVPVGLMALVLTGTRGATLASFPTAILIIWSLKNANQKVRALALTAVVCAAALVYLYAPRGQLDRIGTARTTTQLGQRGAALSDRWYIWTASLGVWVHHPIQGVGVATHRDAVTPTLSQQTIYKTPSKQAHNTYISVLTETGIVGELLFLGVLLTVFLGLRELSGWQRWYWSAQVGVVLIGFMSLSLEDSKSVWIFLSLPIAAAAAARAERVTETATPGPAVVPERVLPPRLEPISQ